MPRSGRVAKTARLGRRSDERFSFERTTGSSAGEVRRLTCVAIFRPLQHTVHPHTACGERCVSFLLCYPLFLFSCFCENLT